MGMSDVPGSVPASWSALVRFGQSLADETRCGILWILLAGPGFPAQMAQELGVSRTKLSNHLKCLRECGLVVAQPHGRRTQYRIVSVEVAEALRGLLSVADCLSPTCAEFEVEGSSK